MASRDLAALRVSLLSFLHGRNTVRSLIDSNPARPSLTEKSLLQTSRERQKPKIETLLLEHGAQDFVRPGPVERKPRN